MNATKNSKCFQYKFSYCFHLKQLKEIKDFNFHK